MFRTCVPDITHYVNQALATQEVERGVKRFSSLVYEPLLNSQPIIPCAQYLACEQTHLVYYSREYLDGGAATVYEREIGGSQDLRVSKRSEPARRILARTTH